MDQAGAEYLAALREARNGESNNDQEEVVEQTEQAESTEESQTETETDNENESEPKNEASQEDSSASEDEAVYYEIDGENVSYEQLKEWRSLSLKENDYTTKSQELEEEKERLKTTMESISGDRAKLQEQLIALQAMLDLDKLSDEQLKEMREFEPEKYIEYKEREQDRKKLIKEAKANSGPAVDVQGEQAKLIKKNPHWLSEGKPTESYQKDMSALQNYYEINGFSQAQVDAVNTNALLAQAVLDASRFKALESKNKATLKQVRKAPPVTKPKAQTNTQKTDEIAKLEAAARKGGVAGGRAYVKLQNMKKG